MEEKSLAMELLEYSKEQNVQLNKNNKRLFIALIIIILLWFSTIGVFIYYICNYGVEETTKISEVQSDTGDAKACIGDNCNNGEINDKSGSLSEN